MKNKINLSLIAFLLVTATLFIVSCVKRDFDQPPIDGDVVTGITATTTVAEVKALHTLGKFDTIKEDLILKVIVTADDRSGNFYKDLYVQDESGGIEILLNATGLYANYPIGRELYIKLKGLVLGDYQNLTQIGGYVFYSQTAGPSLEGIPSGLISSHVLKGSRTPANPIVPRTLTMSQITPSDYQSLVTLTDTEFSKGDTSQFYADAVGKNSVNRKLEDCAGKTVTLYSSGYATFANVKTPTQKGTITGILLSYSNKPELVIRDLNDVAMTDVRCGGGGTGTGGHGVGTSGGPVNSLNEAMDGITNSTDANLTGWFNWSPYSTGRLWQGKTYLTEKYIQATAYLDPLANLESWLITPSINASTTKSLSFRSAIAYWKHEGLTILTSTNFNGTTPNTATWTPLTGFTLAGSATGNNIWVNSGSVNLPTAAKIWVAFKYVGDNSVGTTSFRLDDIIVQ